MDFDACVSCGFACEAVCPVGKATGDRVLSRFLEAVLRDGEIVSWPCAGCKACDAACPGELSPREMVNRASQAYLRRHENTLCGYVDEYLETGRLGTSAVDVDSIIPLETRAPVPFLQAFDEVVVFPGCVVSARHPAVVAHLVELLGFLGVGTGRVAVEDGACCGSFLARVDGDELDGNARHVVSSVLPDRTARHGHPARVLVVTACGSCTDTLRHVLDAGQPGRAGGVDAGGARNAIEIMHHLELLARPDVLAAIVPNLARHVGDPRPVYIQVPCLATRTPAGAATVKRATRELLGHAGFRVVVPDHDLGCCGASLLDTHRDVAIQYGIKHLDAIERAGATCALVGCGNCHRMLDGFKPSMEIAADRSFPVATRFVLDVVMDALRGRAPVARGPR